VRTLSSGDQFIGWGNLAFSEFMPNRTCVLHAQLGAVTDDAHTTTCSYSVHRGNWTGMPDDNPTIFTKWDQVASKTTFYISWNGATRVESWEIHSVANNEKREATAAVDSMLGTVVKMSMRLISINRLVGQGYAVALGKDGNGLGQTVVVAPLCAKGHGV
jgi:hypothetical protein